MSLTLKARLSAESWAEEVDGLDFVRELISVFESRYQLFGSNTFMLLLHILFDSLSVAQIQGIQDKVDQGKKKNHRSFTFPLPYMLLILPTPLENM